MQCGMGHDRSSGIHMVLEVPEGIELPLIRQRMQSVFSTYSLMPSKRNRPGGRLDIASGEAGNSVLLDLLIVAK
jgi:hypothetical protein